jgi:hypothetical protein
MHISQIAFLSRKPASNSGPKKSSPMKNDSGIQWLGDVRDTRNSNDGIIWCSEVRDKNDDIQWLSDVRHHPRNEIVTAEVVPPEPEIVTAQIVKPGPEIVAAEIVQPEHERWLIAN